MSDAAKSKAKQRWATEKPKLDNAALVSRGSCCSESNSLSRYNLVQKFIPMPEALKIPDAKAAVEKNGKIGKDTGTAADKSQKQRRIEEARNKGRKVHFASLMDLCHLKNSELELQYQKYRGRVVLRGDMVKDYSGACAVFTEQGSSASQMTAAKVMDIISRLPGCAGQAADAVSAYTQVKMEAAPTLLNIPKVRMPRYLDTSIERQMAKIMVQYGRPSCSS